MNSPSHSVPRLSQLWPRHSLTRLQSGTTPTARGIGLRVFLDIPYTNKEEYRNKLDLFLPDLPSFPVVVFAHGGAWVSGDKALYGYLGAFLARHGIGAVLANYNLAPQASHPTAARDLARAFAWTREHIGAYGGDQDRLYLCGHSAGGHIAALLATNDSFLAAENLGVEHVRGVVAISGIYYLHWNIIVAGLGFVFRDSDKTAASPFWNVKPGRPPFLILRAQKELLTLSRQADQFHKRLLRHSCRSRLVVAPREDHHSIIQNAVLPTAEYGKEILRFVREE
jgi:acetyl esterase/lipase